MYSMKDVCLRLGMPYETLKFYCKEGLVPNVKRDRNNHRRFDEKNIAWISGLQYLKKCGMSIKDMKEYMNYCMLGVQTIPQRQEMLLYTKEELEKKAVEIKDCIDYINDKQAFYEDVLEGKIEYTSNLINTDVLDKNAE